MDINFNNLRKQALYKYDSLTTTLNKNIYDGGQITLNVDEIQQAMDDLRQYLMAIGATFDADNPEDFGDVTESVGDIATFNSEKS